MTWLRASSSGWLAAILAFAIAGQLMPEFYITLLNYVGLYALVALGLVVLTGVLGIISFGQAAFVGIGAYTTAVLSTHYGLSPWLGLLAGLAINLVAALILGGVTLRLSGHYLPLGTICWSVSLYYVFGNIETFGGQLGMTGIPAISIFGVPLDEGRRMYYLIWAITIAALILTDNVLRSRPGRAMRALKNSHTTAENFGVNGTRVKMGVFIYAALLASVSGWLYAHLLRFVNPSPFGIAMGIEYLFMAVVGGPGSVWGAVLGSGIITVLREFLQQIIPGFIGRSGNFEIIVFGALIILLLQLNRDKGFSKLFALWKSAAPLPKLAADLPERGEAAQGGPLMSVRCVRKRFGGLTAVDNVSFDVDRAKIIAAIGPNGAGKSTLFNLLTRVLPIDEGEIEFRGERINTLPPHELITRGVARTYQHVKLVPDSTVLENVMFGAHRRVQRGAFSAAFGLKRDIEAAVTAEAVRQIRRVGLEKWMDEPAGSLALGQQRLVEVARALCAGPDLLLLDEPAAGLRHAEKEDLASLLKEVRRAGTSVLLVEHDMRFVMGLADDIVVLNFGTKLAQGTPAEIRGNPRVLEAYLGGSLS